MEINYANADSIRKTIRITLNRNRSALLDHKRLQSTIEYFSKTECLKRWQLMSLDNRELKDRLSRFNSRSRWGR